MFFKANYRCKNNSIAFRELTLIPKNVMCNDPVGILQLFDYSLMIRGQGQPNCTRLLFAVLLLIYDLFV